MHGILPRRAYNIRAMGPPLFNSPGPARGAGRCGTVPLASNRVPGGVREGGHRRGYARRPAGRAPSNDGGNHQPAWRARLRAPGSYSAVIRADERGNAAISPLANRAGLGRRLVDVAVANHCTRRPGDGRRLLGPASIRSPPLPRRGPRREPVSRAPDTKSALSTERAPRHLAYLPRPAGNDDCATMPANPGAAVQNGPRMPLPHHQHDTSW